MVTFDVSPVEPGRTPMPGADLFASVQARLGSPVVACGANKSRLVSVPRTIVPPEKASPAEGAWGREPHHWFGRGNAFLTALTVAFAGHYPLVLSPDDVWLCIAQGFAQHVSSHPEVLRSRFTPHADPTPLIVNGDELPARSPDDP